VIMLSTHVQGRAVTQGRVRSGSQGHESVLDTRSADVSAAAEADTGRIATVSTT